ncbi:hypothetical protein RC431_002928 [Salmonella enterica]|nr:hypothetical protein [Salmonella enterica]
MAHQNALAAAQAKAKAARDALTLRLTQESNARIPATLPPTAVTGSRLRGPHFPETALRLMATPR